MRFAALVALALVTTGAGAQGNFSQYPGWSEYHAAYPPRAALPDYEQRGLLERHRPRFYLPPGHAGMIDFYRDYIAQGRLYDGDGKLVSEDVTQGLLNRYADEPLAHFMHVPRAGAETRATVYARADRGEVDFGANGSHRFTFLTYHAVFRRSGLPAGLGGWRSIALALVGNLEDWHQLDHYTSASVVLDDANRPVALMLQQHNYRRSYVIGESVPLAADGRPELDVAIRSNELYPHAPERRRHRAAGFATPKSLRYMMGFGEPPWNAADDVTEGAVEVQYALEFLPQDDAFYTFKGYLGERRVFPGRDGPPGADYNIWPALKPLGRQLLSGYWREGDEGDLRRLEATWARTGDSLDFLRAQSEAFAEALARVHRLPAR